MPYIQDLVELIEVITELNHGASGQWSGRCPFCEKDLLTLKVDRSKQLWCCIACDRGGGAREFVKALRSD